MLKRYTKRYLFSLIWITIFTSIQGQSPSTTSDFRDYRLELFEEEKGYDAAKTVCDGRNAWLVEIKDKETQAAVQQLTKNAIWIGLHHDGEWKWNGIDKLKFTNWVSEHPKAISGQLNNSCVVSRTPDGKWLDRNCQNSYRYVCQSDKSWIIFNNETTLQIISSPRKNFVESQQACANNGSTLVEIKTDALDIFINQKLRKKSRVKNEPNGYRGENCLAKFPSAGFKWIDDNCNYNAGYICQRNISSGDCGRDVCSDKGTCQVNGNRYKCTCEAGYFGTKCEKELILISTPTTLYEIKRGRNLTAIFNITSYDGNFNISVSTTGNHEVTSKSTTGITSNTVSSTLMFTLGPFETARNLTYNFTANRIFYKSYPKVVSIMVVITDECDSMPCMNGGSCVYSVTVPYYNCTCQPAYIGNNCGERRFINNTANNCQYHVNRYDIKSFAEANLTCSSLGGALAMMKTTEIQDWVESQIITQYEATGPTILFWIGGYIVNDSWIWLMVQLCQQQEKIQNGHFGTTISLQQAKWC
uniref:protein serrate-like n=1 Tax=Styela clava TaxID=7725 RepID=UPI00193A1B02|nr:protein serrate-like [Styela clava]